VSRSFLIVFCGLLLTVSAFSCDITLPAFWSMQQDLGAPIEWVQAIVPVFLFAAAFGQIMFGPVSDRFGRRPVIIGGLLLYIAGTTIAMLAQSIATVHAGRVAQGLGSACGVAIGRAVLRDVSHGSALAQAMALAMAIFALGPITAPLLGFGLVAAGGWRAIFLGMAAFAGLLLATAVLRFRETNAEPDPDALRPERLLASLARIATHRQSRYFLVLAALTQFGIVSFVANGPRFFKTAFGIDGLPFAALFAVTGLGIILGQVVNTRMIARVGVLVATRVAAFVLLAVTVLIVLLSMAGLLSAGIFAGLMFAFNTSFLVVIANSASLVIDPHREIAGFASSAYGAFTQVTSSVLAVLTIPLFAGALLPWAASMLAVTAVVFVAMLVYRPAAALPVPSVPSAT
jgi:DHA1 family bicyclomycin/chloramphenicol resistance-like MFS transporter